MCKVDIALISLVLATLFIKKNKITLRKILIKKKINSIN